MSVMTPRRFGRIHAPDPRDASYPMRALLPAVPSTRTQRYWSATGWWGDQKDTPECVAYAWLHWLEDGPVPQRSAPPPIILPDVLYHDAQDRDEFPGTNYDGTSVRGAVKALVARGFVKSYHWAQTLEDIVQALLEVGPVVIGLVWYESMMDTDARGRLHVTGAIAGGHAVKLDGVNTITREVRLKNSWGRAWGHAGFAYMAFDDLNRLIFSESGEACLAVEIEKKAA